MPELSDNYGLVVLKPGDKLSSLGYGFLDGNIKKIDRILGSSAAHDHTSTASALVDPVTKPTLTLDTTSGNLPAGTTIRYRYTYVDQYGSETAGSPEETVSTAAVIQKPAAPSATVFATGGVLLGGAYSYVLTAYTASGNSEETNRGGSYNTSVSFTTSTNLITLTLPSKPAGATGFNIYRRSPSEAYHSYIASTTGSSYNDDGAIAPNVNRQPPTNNLTNSTNNVDVQLPGAVPANATWKIYRTYVSGNWNASDLKHVIEETFPLSGVIVANFVDNGNGVGLETIPEVTEIAAVPGKISNNEVDFSYSNHTPTFGGFTSTNATIVARYSQIGGMVHYYGHVVFGAATEVTAQLTVDLPVTAASTSQSGSAMFYDDSTPKSFPGSVVPASTTVLNFVSSDGASDNSVDDTEPFNWTTTDEFRWNITYEAA